MNIHHLELFYYVARYGGISQACRQMPYGVQQPAVSAQLLRLEDELGVKLFERRPFALTEAGRELEAFAAPFFGQLPDMEQRLKGVLAHRLRVAGPTQLMRDHLPELLNQMERKFPKLNLKLFEADREQAVDLLERGEVDLSIVVQEGGPAQGMRSRVLIELPMVLLVEADRGPDTVAEVLVRGAAGGLHLIALQEKELLPRLFAKKLRSLGRRWPVSMEVSSTDLVARYVSLGLGVGLAVKSPTAVLPENVRSLDLRGFPRLPIAAVWRGKLPPAPAAFFSELELRARHLAGR